MNLNLPKIPHRNIKKVWLGLVVVNKKIVAILGHQGHPQAKFGEKGTILFLLFFSQMHVFDGPFAVGRGSVAH